MPISEQAFSLLGEQQKPESRIFGGLRSASYHSKDLRDWLKAAGITKHITFHCFRHTFATLQMFLGTDILPFQRCSATARSKPPRYTLRSWTKPNGRQQTGSSWIYNFRSHYGRIHTTKKEKIYKTLSNLGEDISLTEWSDTQWYELRDIPRKKPGNGV